MYIQNNKMLPDNSSLRTIKYYGCSLISTNGPNIEGKLNLSGVEIPYESQYTSRLILNPNSENQPLMYGFLGNKVTFLALKITYDETDPRCIIEEEQYIEYYYADNPSEIRYANKLLVLTGNSTKRIPQIYLNNPSDIKVQIDVMCANLPQSDLTNDDIVNDTLTYVDLYHNSILSDKIYNCTDDVNTVTGSTQLQVMNNESEVSLYLDYDEIDTIERDVDNMQLIVNTKSDTVIKLVFLSQFEMYQAHSRIEWVIEDNLNRYLSASYPTVDTLPPTMTLNIGVDPISSGSNVYPFPINRDPNTGNFIITPDDIKYYFIDTIEDDRDGVISVADAEVTIRKDGEINTLTGITETGLYSIIISISDIANNQSIKNYFILVDDVAPDINFYSNIGDSFELSIPEDTEIPSQGITYNDILRETVESVIDNVEGNLPKDNIELYILSGNTTGSSYVDYQPIYEPGEYFIRYIIKDSSLNENSYDKIMTIDGDIVIISGSTFTYTQTMTNVSFIFNGDNDGDYAYVEIGNETIMITNDGGELVWDSGRTNEYTFSYSGEIYNVSYEGTIYNIIFNGYGSLLFTIEKIGSSPTITNFELQQNYKESGQDAYITSDIINIDNDYILSLDDNSGSIYNINISSLDYNRETMLNLDVYLDSYELTFTGTTLFDYYYSKYPNYNAAELNDILSGNTAYGELFYDNRYIINDFISDDNIKNIVLHGDHLKGTFNYRVDIIDDEGQTNEFRFSLVIN